MFSDIENKFKARPKIGYAMSIVASWAGVGSLMNFRTLALNNGAVAAIIWAVFNTLACILFGLAVEYLPYVRKIMQTKVMFYFIGLLTVFQTWTQMSGIREIFADTVIGEIGGTIIAYATCVIFILILLRKGMIRNVLTDSASWIIVYGLLVAVVVASLAYTGTLNSVPLVATSEGIKTGLWKGFLLLPGPFTYPYYYALYDYNEKNKDGTKKISVKKSFIIAGLMFGAYMLFAAILTWVNFSPVLNLLKAILITIVAVSSVSTYIYSEYLVFGKKAGIVIDVLTVGLWQFLIPLGVMGIWTLMSEIRVYIICAVILLAICKRIYDRKREGVK